MKNLIEHGASALPLTNHQGNGKEDICLSVSDETGEPWICTVRADFPHTVHEAASALGIHATWED